MDLCLSRDPLEDDPQGKARRGYSRRHIAFVCLALLGLQLCLFIRQEAVGAKDDARSRGDVAFSVLMHPDLEHVPETEKYTDLHGVERLPFKSDDHITPHRPPQEAAAAAAASQVWQEQANLIVSKMYLTAAAKAEKKAAAAEAKSEKRLAAAKAEKKAAAAAAKAEKKAAAAAAAKAEKKTAARIEKKTAAAAKTEKKAAATRDDPDHAWIVFSTSCGGCQRTNTCFPLLCHV